MSARSPIFHWDLGTELSRRWTWYYFYKMLNLSALGNNYRIWEPGKSGDFSVKSFYEKACELWRYFHALLLFKVSEGPSEGSFFFWMAYRGKSFWLTIICAVEKKGIVNGCTFYVWGMLRMLLQETCGVLFQLFRVHWVTSIRRLSLGLLIDEALFCGVTECCPCLVFVTGKELSFLKCDLICFYCSSSDSIADYVRGFSY